MTNEAAIRSLLHILRCKCRNELNLRCKIWHIALDDDVGQNMDILILGENESFAEVTIEILFVLVEMVHYAQELEFEEFV